ncbi:hypothetical protein CEXT_643281 [Caerostris extrusa]|uniref:Uncharacterized protein n=1 Tax=Caerostris extrusa TaxID=172846 RepID=A0AAV4SXR6_CAEEX|nr:hypothetical protein CEXT_643281 [Caerostris extrusa]
MCASRKSPKSIQSSGRSPSIQHRNQFQFNMKVGGSAKSVRVSEARSADRTAICWLEEQCFVFHKHILYIQPFSSYQLCGRDGINQR